MRGPHVKERNSPGYEGVGNPLPLFVTPSSPTVIALTLFLLEPRGRLLRGTLALPPPRVFLAELGESRELEQAVETTFPWERRLFVMLHAPPSKNRRREMIMHVEPESVAWFHLQGRGSLIILFLFSSYARRSNES
ncbi:hypothetical protein EYF80_042647 [Liparis tanakae]|uniref:Uncharacterized protein n=1 Tax=Liparis tanakae TaxID=230148 RepID=A0A4Z2G2M1_9TELE|nr:hypothetical protein EYF80_042647 [Liparis tanakae]